MAKEDYSIKIVSKSSAKLLLDEYHYLSNISKGFKSGYNYGLYVGDSLVGVCIFTGFPVPELAKGCYGLERDQQQGLFELSRLCLVPNFQKSEHNLASWFVSRCIKLLRRETVVRSILSYADDSFHEGIVYRACNFKYYGLSVPKKDFWFKLEDGSYKKHTRGTVKGKVGEWRDRTRKRRYLLTYDKALVCRWQEVSWDKNKNK